MERGRATESTSTKHRGEASMAASEALTVGHGDRRLALFNGAFQCRAGLRGRMPSASMTQIAGCSQLPANSRTMVIDRA